MTWTRIIPQPLARMWCWLHDHELQRYAAEQGGTLMVIYTCRCGKKQDAKLLPANRRVRREAARRGRTSYK